MGKIAIVGIDVAKVVFQIHAVDASGKVMVRKQMRRPELERYLSSLEPCVVAMEACGGSHALGRFCHRLGHEVRLISPQFVKPYVKSNKNDRVDAEAIVEAAQRPGMRFVPLKGERQQAQLAWHRVRDRLVCQRTALMNELRGLLQEFGVVFPAGVIALRRGVQKILGGSGIVPAEMLMVVEQLYEEWNALEGRISFYEARIVEWYRSSGTCQRLGQIPGIGPITATALEASIGDFHSFRNGRALAASLGLVPRQCSSGGKTILRGISKRGDPYLRRLLIHGARNVVVRAAEKNDKRSIWIQEKLKTRGFNRTCVAMANKNARMCWALVVHEADYRQEVVKEKAA
jgi:transposase